MNGFKMFCALAGLSFAAPALSMSVQFNALYDPTVQTQKYSPLRINYKASASDTKKQCGAIFDNRSKRLKVSGISFSGDTKQEKLKYNPKKPEVPMVVVSSNRSAWIKKQLTDDIGMGKSPTENWLKNPYHNDKSSVWYDPRRSNKTLFVVVHPTEYDKYKKALSTINKVHVIGCALDGSAGEKALAGFGANRYCSLKLMKFLGYPTAWFVDDNVGHVAGFGAQPNNTMAKFEKTITENNGPYGIGFKPHNEKKLSRDDAKQKIASYTKELAFTAKREIKRGREIIKAPSLLQQVVLWDVSKLAKSKDNFSPLFVTGKEDKTFSAYLNSKRNSSLWQFRKALVVKLDASADKSGASPDTYGLITKLILAHPYAVDFVLPPQSNLDKLDLGAVHGKKRLLNYFRYAKKNKLELPLITTSKAKEQIMDTCLLKGYSYTENIFSDTISATLSVK